MCIVCRKQKAAIMCYALSTQMRPTPNLDLTRGVIPLAPCLSIHSLCHDTNQLAQFPTNRMAIGGQLACLSPSPTQIRHHITHSIAFTVITPHPLIPIAPPQLFGAWAFLGWLCHLALMHSNMADRLLPWLAAQCATLVACQLPCIACFSRGLVRLSVYM